MKNQSSGATSLATLTIAMIAGCSSMATTQPTAAEKQDAALNDPMGYKPRVGRDITGGDITRFDHDGFKQDMNDALNP